MRSIPARLLTVLLLVAGCAEAVATPVPTPSPTPRPTPAATSAAEGVDSLLREAVEATIDAGTVALTMTMRFEGSSLIPEGTELVATGLLGFGDRRQGSLSMDMSDFGQGNIDMVVDDADLWLRFDGAMASLIPEGKWAHIDGNASGAFATAFRNVMSGPNDSTLLVYFLLASIGDGRVVGTETIDGVSTTHVSTTLDLDLALDRVPAGIRDALVINIAEVREQGIDPTILGEAWIDADGLIHRQRLGYTLSAIQGGGTMVADIEMKEHGLALILPIPSDADTVEADEIVLPSPS